MNTKKGQRTYLDQVNIQVSGSTANLGLFFDRAGAAISRPSLRVILRPISGKAIKLYVVSSAPTPAGRERGYAGVKALEQYMRQIGIQRGVELRYEDTQEEGFPTGGTGLSGAESVGAVVAAAILFNQAPTEKEVILASAKGEPNEHKDNVAPSTMGGIVFISDIPNSKEVLIHKVNPPRNLGLAIGFSTHLKIGGTEGTRSVLEAPRVPKSVFINQVGRAVSSVLSLQQGRVEDFLKLVSGDGFHEPRRANAGMYGEFTAEEFYALKRELYFEFNIGLAVSGAGPNMQFWFDKRKYPKGISQDARYAITSWFANHGIDMKVEYNGIAKEGAYAYAQRNYPNSALAKGK